MVDAWADRQQEIYSSTGQVKVSNSLVPAVVAVTYSATPDFDATLGNAFQITLTGDVTSSTLSNAGTGQFIFITVTQDGTGGHTFVWPANFQNAPTIVSGASQSTNIVGFYDGTNFNISGQWNTSSGGTGTGTVTSVGMTGDGIVYEGSVTGSPVTTTGTLVPSLASATSGHVLAGPIGSDLSNVSYRQSKIGLTTSATSGTATFDNPVQSGSAIVVVPLATSTGHWFYSTASDNLSSTYTEYGGAAASHRSVGFAASSGSCTVTVTGTGFTVGFAFLIVELPGASAYVDASSWTDASWNDSGATVPYTITSSSITPSASTDSYLIIHTSSGSCYPSSGFITSPVSSLASTVDSGSVETGAIWLYAPGNTGAFTFGVTMTTHTGSCPNGGTTFVLCFNQDASSSAAPWVSRRLVESDLPASSISAVQSVTQYTLGSNFTVTPGSDNTVFSETITMPSQGGPFRVLAQYGLFLKAGSSGQPWDVWMSDGTTVFNGWEWETTDATKPSANSSSMSPNSYSNSESVTFTVHVEIDGAATSVYVYDTATAGGAQSFLSLSVVQSRN